MLTFYSKSHLGSGGIRTHASEETGALNQRLRPLGHATYKIRSVASGLWRWFKAPVSSEAWVRIPPLPR
ncbi:hypothetical protein FF38_01668 [Lucilia cuprina]|uniref:Uncharacterized protein n=1 Tax=Lucilia cuprina TaxID=7375 RepID=A0A0L0BRM6_LUCCU|nr:hypothetical protein FF38_01668 [Lucilia cuprina]